VRRLKIYFLGGPPVYRKANFNPDQPRVPAGNPDGGQWTDDGSITVSGSIDLSAAKIRGHHFVPRSLYRELPLRPETRKVFENAVTGPLKGAPHHWSKEHEEYNKAVKEAFKAYLNKSKIEASKLTPEGARSFLNEIRKTHDPRIRLFNMRIFRMEFQFYLRRIPRRIE
jgi:hypothetical protein